MTRVPLVTVITPSFNQGRFIEQTIKSVLSQDYPNVEYLVVDGGSTDETLGVLKSYEGRLSWVSERDAGQTDAINKGLKKSRGEIVCWLNSDDTYEPGAIAKAVDYFNANPDVMLLYGEGNEIAEDGSFLHRFPATQRFDLWTLTYVHDYILQPTTFFKKEVFDTIDYPKEELHWCMDWDLWVRIGQNFEVGYIDQVLANSRIYSDTKTGSGGIKRFKEIAMVMRSHGKKRFPLGYFLYGVDSIETICKGKWPFLYNVISPFFFYARKILGGIQANYQGVYADKWLGPKASLMLAQGKCTKKIQFDIEVPSIENHLPLVARVWINGKFTLESFISTSGRSHIIIESNIISSNVFEIEFRFDKHFSPDNDPRRLSCLLHGITYNSD